VFSGAVVESANVRRQTRFAKLGTFRRERSQNGPYKLLLHRCNDMNDTSYSDIFFDDVWSNLPNEMIRV
jgi:hypothetical protein